MDYRSRYFSLLPNPLDSAFLFLLVCDHFLATYMAKDFAPVKAIERIKKRKLSFWSPHRMSRLLSPLETEKQRREEIRRIILEKKGGYRVDTDVEICLVYGLTSLI